MRAHSLTALLVVLFLSSGCQNKKKATPTPKSPVVSSTQGVPECTPATKSASLYYVKETGQFLVCDSTGLHQVESKGTPSPTATSAANSSGGYFLRKVVLDAGSECHYGGFRAEGGMDTNANGALDPAEVSSSFPVCDSGIENVAQQTFKKYVHSVGVVVVKTKGLLSSGETSAGTGWIVGDGMVVTNGHVVKTSGSVLTTGTEMWFYVPKTTIAAETILTKGLPNYAGFSPSLKDFDGYKASAVDQNPYTTTGSDVADLSFLTVSGLTGREVLPLSDNIISSTSGTGTDVSDLGTPNYVSLGDGIFTINYSQVQGPRLSIGTVTTIETCAAWFKATSSSCASEIGLPDNRRLLFWWGYGDHGGSGSPVFDRFGKVTGIFTFGSVPPETFQAAGQFASDIKYWLAKPRVWKSL